MSEIGCHFESGMIVCRKEAGTGCPGSDGGAHYFIYDSYSGRDGRMCMDCGIGEKEALS